MRVPDPRKPLSGNKGFAVDLFGFEAPPAKLKRRTAPKAGRCRLFFALLPGDQALEELLALGSEMKSRFGLNGKLHAKDRLHLTLDHVGDFDAMPHDVVGRACEAAEALASRTSRFSVGLDRAVSFGRHVEKPPFVLTGPATGNPALRQFRTSLWDALAVADVPGGPRSFTPHVTLLYDTQTVSEQSVATVSWPAAEFVLVHSAMQQTRYEFLGRWSFMA